MARLTIKEAVAIAPVSESTLRRDIRSGRVSSEKDDRGRRRIDSAELARVYGQLRQSTDSNDTEMNAVDTPNNGTVDTVDTTDTSSDNPKIVALLENQIADLKNQLARAASREDALTERLAEAHLLLLKEQKRTDKLMLPPPEQSETEKTRGWIQRLIGAS